MSEAFKPSVGKVGSPVYPWDHNFVSTVSNQMKQIQDNFNAWVSHMREQGGQVLFEALQPTWDKSQERVPVKTGALKESGYFELDRTDPTRPTVLMGYAQDDDPDYAAFVHEDPVAFHQPPTSNKFLQGPLEEDAQSIKERVELGFKKISGA